MDAILKDLEQKTRSILEAVKQELSGIRTNRPAPQLVEDIQVEYLGQMLKVKQLGSISILPPRDIQVSVWDKNAVLNVAKAIETSSLKLNPSVSGNVVHIKMPPLTEERREEFTKVAKASAEKWRIKLRNLRDEANRKVVQALEAKTISEDQKFKSKDKIQETTDKINKEIETALNNKIREISE